MKDPQWMSGDDDALDIDEVTQDDIDNQGDEDWDTINDR